MPFLNFFLLSNTEALLLIDNQQAEAGKIHIGLQQTVRTDKNINLTVGNLLQNSALLLRRTKAIQQANLYTEIAHALLEGNIMLLCQHCRRCQYSHLLTVKHSLKGSTQGHLCFAVADITAEQTFHRLRLFHISLDFGNRLQLVRCFLIRKGCFKVLLQLTVRRKGMARHNLPLRI